MRGVAPIVLAFLLVGSAALAAYWWSEARRVSRIGAQNAIALRDSTAVFVEREAVLRDSLKAEGAQLDEARRVNAVVGARLRSLEARGTARIDTVRVEDHQVQRITFGALARPYLIPCHSEVWIPSLEASLTCEMNVAQFRLLLTEDTDKIWRTDLRLFTPAGPDSGFIIAHRTIISESIFARPSSQLRLFGVHLPGWILIPSHLAMFVLGAI